MRVVYLQYESRLFSTECIVSMQEQIREIGPCSGTDKGDVAERALQRAIEEYRLQRPELVRTEFHSRSLEGIAGQLGQEKLKQERRDRYIDQICLVTHKLLHQNKGLLKVQWKV